MNPPQINLQPGSTNAVAVRQLQDWLVANGFMTQAQVNTGYGTYGPQTTQAVKMAQQKLGVDNSSGPGYWGPRTIAAVSSVNPPAAPSSSSSNAPKTQAELGQQYASAAISHPALAGNSPETIAYATSTGDYSALVNGQGQPFSAADQASALSTATAQVSPYFQAEQAKETADTEAALAAKKASYEKYLSDQATAFQADKATQDQQSANQGVLFSGSRVQKLQQLGDAYSKNNEYQKTAYGADIGSTARDFGYKYGDAAAGGLSKYYSLGGNTYNPNVATGGVGSAGLSSIYNANQGFQGTQVNAAKTAAQQRAAGLLANKGNKLLSTGYTNQF